MLAIVSAVILLTVATPLASPPRCKRGEEEVSFLQGQLGPPQGQFSFFSGSAVATTKPDPLAPQSQPQSPDPPAAASQSSDPPTAQSQPQSGLDVELTRAEAELDRQLQAFDKLDDQARSNAGGGGESVAVPPLVSGVGGGGGGSVTVAPLVSAAFVGSGGSGFTKPSPFGQDSNSSSLEPTQLLIQGQELQASNASSLEPTQLFARLLQEEPQVLLDWRRAETTQAMASDNIALQSSPEDWQRAEATQTAKAAAADKAFIGLPRSTEVLQVMVEQLQKKADHVEHLAEHIDAERELEREAKIAERINAEQEREREAKEDKARLEKELEAVRARESEDQRLLSQLQNREHVAEARERLAALQAEKMATAAVQVAKEVQKVQHNVAQTDEIVEEWSQQALKTGA